MTAEYDWGTMRDEYASAFIVLLGATQDARVRAAVGLLPTGQDARARAAGVPHGRPRAKC
eukprot:9905028-Lingulodinium_polyedra.AAC.1